MISRRTVFSMYQFKDQEFSILSIIQNCRLIGKQLPNISLPLILWRQTGILKNPRLRNTIEEMAVQ